LERVDAALASPREPASPLQTSPVVSSPTVSSPTFSVPPAIAGSNDVAPRKRLRRDLESADMPNQSNLPSDERSVKRQKLVLPQPDILSRINKHRASMMPPDSLATSVASRTEQDPDIQMTETTNPKREVPMDATPTTAGLSIKGAAAATKISIKGAAATTKVNETLNHSLRPPQLIQAGKLTSDGLPRPSTVTREPSISSVMQTLRIQPMPSSSMKPMDGIRTRPSPQSPPEIQDSLKRLLLGKPGEKPPPQETEVQPLPKALPRTSLLDRIQGAKGTLPTTQPQAPAATIFDRVGIPPKIRGGNAGPRSNGPKKRGV
jgi:hypothetical protein